MGDGGEPNAFFTRGSYKLLSRLFKGTSLGSVDVFHPAHAVFRVSTRQSCWLALSICLFICLFVYSVKNMFKIKSLSLAGTEFMRPT
jgi:hypothetical protein